MADRAKRCENRWSDDEKEFLEEKFYEVLTQSASRKKRIDLTCPAVKELLDYTGRSKCAIRERIRRDERYQRFIAKNNSKYESHRHWEDMKKSPIRNKKKPGRVKGSPSKQFQKIPLITDTETLVSKKIQEQQNTELARKIYGVVSFDQYNQILTILNNE